MLVQERGGTYQHRCHRIEYGTAKRDAGSGKTAESQRLLSRIYLRHDFTEKQQQKCKDYCQNEELCNGRMKLEHIHKEEVAEHDYGYIHEVVRNQNRCQQTFAVVQQITDFLIRGCFLSAIAFRSDGEREKKAISEADAKPETSKSKPANTMATTAEIEGVCTDIPLKTSANWHK